MAIYARLENGTYAEVTGVYKTDGTEVTEIFQGDRLVYSASNEIYGSLPLYYSGRGFELIDYMLYGNTVQDGTPSPDAPVDAAGSGVRTGNIINPEDMLDGYFINPSGVIEGSSRRTTTPIITVNGAYMVLTYSTNLDRVLALYAIFSNGAMIRRLTGIASGAVIDISQADSICVSFYSADSQVYVQSSDLQIQLAYGSTALPYEPYGFKLSPTVNGTEYPIYLGTVPATRRIKKLVLTGEENWSSVSSGLYRIMVNGYLRLSNIQIGMSSHFGGGYTVGAAPAAKRDELAFLVSGSGNNYMYLSPSQYLTTEEFKSYLAAQYANGTPVTVWYVLAKPETAVVNEPLMKIGDYADTISFAQAGVTIPTVSGANVLDVTSPVKPSEVYIKGKGINPTGYGQLKDVNAVNILDKDGRPIQVHGQ